MMTKDKHIKRCWKQKLKQLAVFKNGQKINCITYNRNRETQTNQQQTVSKNKTKICRQPKRKRKRSPQKVVTVVAMQPSYIVMVNRAAMLRKNFIIKVMNIPHRTIINAINRHRPLQLALESSISDIILSGNENKILWNFLAKINSYTREINGKWTKWIFLCNSYNANPWILKWNFFVDCVLNEFRAKYSFSMIDLHVEIIYARFFRF